MKHGRGLLWAAGALLVAASTHGMRNAPLGAEGGLQPYGELAAGRYLDARTLDSGPAPSPGTSRSERWERARELGLEVLITRPAQRRGAYDDHGAVHSAWSSRDER